MQANFTKDKKTGSISILSKTNTKKKFGKVSMYDDRISHKLSIEIRSSKKRDGICSISGVVSLLFAAQIQLSVVQLADIIQLKQNKFL